MKSFKEPDRAQQLLFTEVDLNSFVEIDNPAYIINQLVDCLDIRAIEEQYNLGIWQGDDPIHPKTYIKVSLLAIHNCRFSLRKIEYDTKYNLVYRWLTGDKVIDHSTIGKFLNKFKLELIDLFSQVITIAKDKGLLDFDLLAIDTVKVRANASYKETKSLNAIQETKKTLTGQLKELFENEAHTESKEMVVLENRIQKLKIAEKILKERMQKNNQETNINITDHDCKIVQQANGEKNTGYCITTAVDTKNDIITHFTIDSDSNDPKKLLPVIIGSREETNESHKTIVADSGFSSIANLEQLAEIEQEALIPDRRFEAEITGETKKGEYDRSHFKYNSAKDYYTCPAKNKLEKTGSLEKNGRNYNLYANRNACINCPHRTKCTDGEYRSISRDTNEKIKEDMRKKFDNQKNQEKYKKRAHSAESPYGDIKHNKKFRIFHRRGLEKVKMETVLVLMLHNMMKIGKQLCLNDI